MCLCVGGGPCSHRCPVMSTVLLFLPRADVPTLPVCLYAPGSYAHPCRCAQAKLLSPKKQHLMFDKHIEDAVLAEEIAARERKFLTETAAAEGATPSADSDALKSIERGCAQMADGGLTAEQFRVRCAVPWWCRAEIGGGGGACTFAWLTLHAEWTSTCTGVTNARPGRRPTLP